MEMFNITPTIKRHNSCVLCEDEGRSQGVEYEGIKELSMHIFISLRRVINNNRI